jgi:uncharacterized protein (TIGR02145 family)
LGSYTTGSSYTAASTLSWPSSVSSSSSVGTVEYAVANPTTFIKGTYSSDYRWTYSSNNNLWTTSSYKKSVYDPCPAGWRVPDGGSDGVWSKARGDYSSFSRNYDDYDEGMYFGDVFGDEYNIWYPAAGYLSYDYGSLSRVGEKGFYWSATSYSYSSAYNFVLNEYDSVYPSDYDYKAYGFSVRCVKE